MKQLEEDDVQQERKREADAAVRVFEEAQQRRQAVERKCLLGLVAWKETA